MRYLAEEVNVTLCPLDINTPNYNSDQLLVVVETTDNGTLGGVLDIESLRVIGLYCNLSTATSTESSEAGGEYSRSRLVCGK